MNNTEYERLKCIWMSSGVVDYKICDYNFDCENCYFDKAMKNILNKHEDKNQISANVIENLSNQVKNLKYDNKIIYLMNGLIAKNICADIFYLGLNPLMECFLDSNSIIEINENISKIVKGQSIIKIKGEWGSFSIISPINMLVYDKINNSVGKSIYPNWYLIIGDCEHEINNYKLTKIDWENSYQKVNSMIDEIRTNEPKIGEMLKDGGIVVKRLYQILGIKKFTEILKILS